MRSMSVCFLRVRVYLPVRFDEACTFVQRKKKKNKQTNKHFKLEVFVFSCLNR